MDTHDEEFGKLMRKQIAADKKFKGKSYNTTPQYVTKEPKLYTEEERDQFALDFINWWWKEKHNPTESFYEALERFKMKKVNDGTE